MLPVIREIQAAGTNSNAAIAAKLNERRVPTAPGGVWTHIQVRAVIDRGADVRFRVVERKSDFGAVRSAFDR